MKYYITSIIATLCALVNIPGVLDGRTFPLVSMVICFLIAIVCAALNGSTHQLNRRIY